MTLNEYFDERGIRVTDVSTDASRFTLRHDTDGMELLVAVAGMMNGAVVGERFNFVEGGVGWVTMEHVG